MNDLPEPLTPPDSDLRDFQFMPIDVVRLRDSGIAVEATGEEFRAALMLWCAAWHQVPAGSLPANDVQLSMLAGFGRVVKEWLKVKDGAMRGFILCADGRHYHPVVAEKVNESWAKKQAYAAKKEAERQRKEAARRADKDGLSGGQVEVVQRTGGDCPAENALKGQGEGQGEVNKKEESCPKRSRVSYPDDFQDFWKAYPTDANMSKVECLKAWKALSAEDREAARAAIPKFRDYCAKNPTYRAVHACRFLSQRRFEGFNAGPSGPIGIDPDIARLAEIEAAARARREAGLNG